MFYDFFLIIFKILLKKIEKAIGLEFITHNKKHNNEGKKNLEKINDLFLIKKTLSMDDVSTSFLSEFNKNK